MYNVNSEHPLAPLDVNFITITYVSWCDFRAVHTTLHDVCISTIKVKGKLNNVKYDFNLCMRERVCCQTISSWYHKKCWQVLKQMVVSPVESFPSPSPFAASVCGEFILLIQHEQTTSTHYDEHRNTHTTESSAVSEINIYIGTMFAPWLNLFFMRTFFF